LHQPINWRCGASAAWLLSRHGVSNLPRLDAAAAGGLAVVFGGLLGDAFDEVGGGEVFSGIAIVRSRSLLTSRPGIVAR